MEDVFEALKLDAFVLEPKDSLENLEGTPFVKEASPFGAVCEFSKFGNKLLELLREAGL